ncbi:hypothetical protein FBY31_4496 [Arthrobacter sp. SLBN-100]|uniref:hypothetical protein n=1 Tax=Arthrobacter sp. SLBN-100 TaxID=2768450 RepID=UPI001150FD5A|nr:hypothetical protein [Arthrobacter sp. SLBN-100]TQJ62112.1 hypothetical protein FBY31_4496 [Arthrobacter sp. SLBN-100]
MDLHLQSDWQRALGQQVEIWKNGKFVREGTVEAVMPDSSILWISLDANSPRQMFFECDGYQLFAHFLPPAEATRVPQEIEPDALP